MSTRRRWVWVLDEHEFPYLVAVGGQSKPPGVTVYMRDGATRDRQSQNSFSPYIPEGHSTAEVLVVALGAL